MLYIVQFNLVIFQANVIAQTHIQFNDRQLFQLIQQHLLSHGMVESAAALQKEANLPVLKPPIHSPAPSPFSYKQLSSTPNRVSGRVSLNTISSILFTALPWELVAKIKKIQMQYLKCCHTEFDLKTQEQLLK